MSLNLSVDLLYQRLDVTSLALLSKYCLVSRQVNHTSWVVLITLFHNRCVIKCFTLIDLPFIDFLLVEGWCHRTGSWFLPLTIKRATCNAVVNISNYLLQCYCETVSGKKSYIYPLLSQRILVISWIKIITVHVKYSSSYLGSFVARH